MDAINITLTTSDLFEACKGLGLPISVGEADRVLRELSATRPSWDKKDLSNGLFVVALGDRGAVQLVEV